jgi:outer membrane protein assembly factor BamB
MFQGDAAHLAEGSGPENLALKWKYQTNGIVISSPSVVDGVVYVGSQDKNIYALDADTGSKIWSFATEFRVRASPAVVGGKVYTGADDGNFYCLDAEDGTQLWKTPAGGIIVPAQSARPLIRSSPTVVGGKVYVGSLDQNLYCLDATSGNVIWTFTTTGPITSTPAVVDGAVYITSSTPRPNGTLYKLNADTGTVIWQLDIPYGRAPDMHASPTVADGMAFQPADAWNYYCINATTGTIKWEYTDVGNTYTFGSVLYNSGRVYFADFFFFVCVNATTGEKIWSNWLSREIYSSPTYAYGRVYIGMENNAFYILDAETGEKISYYDGFDSNCIWSSPALTNGRVYIGSLDGNVYCFEEDTPDAPLISTEVLASLSKSQVDKDLSESVTVSGNLSPIYAPVPVKVTFTKPDGTTIDVSATTTSEGDFGVSYTPDAIGDWTVTAWWEGDEDRTFAFTEDMTLKVVGEEEPTNGNGEEPPPEEEGIPTEYIYAAAAVIAIIVIAIAAYVYMKRGK